MPVSIVPLREWQQPFNPKTNVNCLQSLNNLVASYISQQSRGKLYSHPFLANWQCVGLTVLVCRDTKYDS